MGKHKKLTIEEKVKINPIFNIDNIKDGDTCGKTGILILVGTLTDDITEDIKFDLPLTYPDDELKCEMTSSKKNDKIEASFLLSSFPYPP